MTYRTLDWTFRLVAFVILLRAVWPDLQADFWPALAILGFGWFLICAVTPSAWGTKPGERKPDDPGPG
jgi:hypothetical protein